MMGTLPIDSATTCSNGAGGRFRRRRQAVEKHQGLELVTSIAANGRNRGFFLGKRLAATAYAAVTVLTAAALADGLRLDAV